MVSQKRIGCSTSRNKGTCGNRLTVSRDWLEETVLGALKNHLMDEELCEAFCKEYTEHLNQVRQQHNASLSGLQKEQAKLEREKAKLIQSIKDGVPGAMLKDDAIRIEARMGELERILATTEEAPVLFHPNMAKRYHEEVQRLLGALNESEHRAEAAQIVRSLVEKIVLVPTEDRSELKIDLYGDLAGILSTATGRGLPPVSSGMVPQQGKHGTGSSRSPALTDIELQQVKLVAGVCNTQNLPEFENKQVKMVAGVGFEPTTFRL